MTEFAVTNASTGEVEQTFDSLPAEQIPEIIQRAHRAVGPWRDTPIAQRAQALAKVGDLFEQRAEELAGIIGREMGKLKSEGLQEVQLVASIFRWYAEHGPAVLEPTELQPQGAQKTVVEHEPLGVCWGSCRGTSPTTSWPASPPPTC